MIEDPSDKKSSGGMTELARKILLTGVGAVFMTEETIRKTLGDLKLPKDAVGSVVDSLKKQKDEVLQVVAQELSQFFSRIKVHEELQKALKGMQINLDAKITFDKSQGSSTTKVEVKKRS